MTLPRFNQLQKYWAKRPPVHISVAKYLLEDESPAQGTNGQQDFSQLFQTFPRA